MKKLMKTGLFCLSGLLLLLGYSSQVQAAGDMLTVTVQEQVDYDYAKSVLDIVNQERQKENAAPLTLDKDLTDAAMIRAAEVSMYFSHTRPDGTSCFSACDTMSGENIAAGDSTPEDVMDSWMNSPGHRSNILNSNFRSMGIGCYKIGNLYYWTQCFSYAPSDDAPTYTGTKQFTQKISIQKSIAELYAYEVKDASNANYMKPGEKGYFMYGLVNTEWSSYYSPISAEDMTFTSSDASIVRMNADGTFEAVNAGTATLTAALKEAPEQQYTCSISCQKPASSDVPSDTPSDTSSDIVKGKTYTVNGITYKITNAAANGSGTVSVTGVTTAKNKLTTLTVPSTVKISGKSFQITSIGAKACKGYTSLSKVTIGNNVKKIGKEAFSGCGKLKTITIKTSKLTSVGAKAIKSINKNATIKVPAKMVKTYKKLFTSNTGYVKTMKIKA